MKKIYTLVAALGFVSSLFAQSTSKQAAYSAWQNSAPFTEKGRTISQDVISSFPNTVNNGTGSVNGVQKATLYTSSINNGEWIVGPGSTGTPYGSWAIKTAASFTSQGGTNIARPTGGAGSWMVLDLDAVADAGGFSETVISTATFSTIGEYALQIKFRQRYTKFNDVTKVIVSTDNGTTWNEVDIPQNDIIANNAANNTTASTFITVDISSVAANQASVQVGFKMTGTNYAYYWGIDDVTVESRPPSNELSITSFYPVFGGYTKVPFDFAMTPDIEVGYKNVGGSIQNNVNLTSKINTSLYTATENTATMYPGATAVSTFSPTQTDIPVLGIGSYMYTASVSADETELTPADNFKFFTQEVTQGSYSLDNNNTVGTLNGTIVTTSTPMWAASYFVYGNYKVNSVDFVVSTLTTAGSVVEVQVFQIPSSWDGTLAMLTPVGGPVTHTITSAEIPTANGSNPVTVSVNLTAATGNAPSGAFTIVSVKKISGTVALPIKTQNTTVKPGEAFYATTLAWIYALANNGNFYWFAIGDLTGSTSNLYIRANFQSSCVTLTGHNVSTTGATCTATNGTVAVTNPTNGIGPYEFLWYTNPMTTGTSVSGLAAGTYDLLVADVSTLTNSGCPTQATATVAFNNTPVTYTKNVTQPSCLLPNGAIAITGESGATPHSYTWTPSSLGNSASVTGLAPGTYTLKVTDADGCFSATDQTVFVNNGVPSTFTLSQTATTSCVATDGTATVATVTGPALSSYSWSTVPVQTDVTATGLAGGTNYTLTAVNTDNCTSSKSILVTATGAPVASTTAVTSVSCFGGNTGSFTIQLVPATPNYTYTVNGGSSTTSSTISGLTAGTYTVTGTDGFCNISTSAVINQPATALSGGTASVTSVACYGGATGSIVITGVTGGTTPYKYSWSGAATGGPQASATIPGLAAGTYNIVVQDAKNCTLAPAIATATVTQPSAAISGSVVTQTDMTAPYSVTISLAGGTPPYQISGTGFTDYTNVPVGNKVISIASAGAGTTDLTIKDAKNCTYTLVMQPVGVKNIETVNNISVFPNPTDNNVTISFNSTEAKNVTVKLVSLNGQEIFTQELPQFVGEYSKNVSMSAQAQGVYFLQIVTDKNVTTKKVVKL